jgi:hypothetical protein
LTATLAHFAPHAIVFAAAVLAPLGQLGSTQSSATQTALFQWFHLEETTQETTPQGTVVHYRPSGERFHNLAEVLLVLRDGQLASASLRLERSFIDGRDSPFARDIAASFLQTGLNAADWKTLDRTILQIQRETGGATVLVGPGDHAVPKPYTDAYRAFLGQTSESTAALTAGRLSIGNIDQGRILEIKLVARTN